MKSFWNWLCSIKRELTLTIAVLTLFIALPLLLRIIDPSAATADLGFLHLIVVGIGRAVLIVLALFAIIKAAFPLFENYMDEKKLKEDWQATSPAHRLIIFFGFISVLLVVITLCVVLI